MCNRFFLSLIGIVLLILGGVFLFTAFTGKPDATSEVQDFSATDTGTTENTNPQAGISSFDFNQSGGFAANFALEPRVIEFEWPEEFRAGESNSVRLAVKFLPDGRVQPQVEVEGNIVQSTPLTFVTYYATHSGNISARLTAPEFEVEAQNSESQTLLPGRDVTWRWTLTPENTGKFTLTVTLFAEWTPLPNVQGSPFRQDIWGTSKSVEVNHVFGIVTIPQASIAGTILAGLGVVTQAPTILDMLSFLLGRRDKRREQQRRQQQYDRRSSRSRRR